MSSFRSLLLILAHVTSSTSLTTIRGGPKPLPCLPVKHTASHHFSLMKSWPGTVRPVVFLAIVVVASLQPSLKKPVGWWTHPNPTPLPTILRQTAWLRDLMELWLKPFRCLWVLTRRTGMSTSLKSRLPTECLQVLPPESHRFTFSTAANHASLWTSAYYHLLIWVHPLQSIVHAS